MNESFKIAFVTGNGKSINGSFGSTKYFEVFTIENGDVKNREQRETYVDNLEKELQTPVTKSQAEASKPAFFSLNVVDKSKEKHMKIAKSISDCTYVISRGMCANAYDSIEQFKMKPILTDIKEFDDAIKQVLEGTIVNQTDKIH